MSYHLGISHFSSLPRQISSPTSRNFLEVSSRQDLTQENKDVLIERLNDLIARLSDHELGDASISAIHSKTDEIEKVVRRVEELDRLGRENSDSVKHFIDHSDALSEPRTPINMTFGSPRMGGLESPLTYFARSPKTTAPYHISNVAKEAELLLGQLTTTVNELKARREESEHIHDLLVTKAEIAAGRILDLEDQVETLHDEIEANQSELRYLRIQIQAIEVQCTEYISLNKDLVLRESISNWKTDWEEMDRRVKARRKTQITVEK